MRLKTSNKLFKNGDWINPLFWKSSERFCRRAIIATTNCERLPTKRGVHTIYYWSQLRLLMVDHYKKQYGPVPSIILKRRLPPGASSLSRDKEYIKWAIRT